MGNNSLNFLRVLFLFALFSFSIARTIEVGKDKEIKDLKSALRIANDGDIIKIYKGIYYGNIILEKSITLEGIDYPLIQGEKKGDTISVKKGRCLIKGLVIRGGGSELRREDSGLKLIGDENIIEKNIFEDTLFGIYLYKSKGNKILNNKFHGRSYIPSPDRGNGIHLYDTTGNIVENNYIADYGDGIYFDHADGNTIKRNYLTRLRYGIHFMFSKDNKFEENISIKNIAGAVLMYGKGNTFRKNILAECKGFRGFGLLYVEFNDSVGEDNWIIGNSIGVYVDNSWRNILRKNTIANNVIGIFLKSSSEENEIYENNIIRNIVQVQTERAQSNNKWFKDGKGNYWSDYIGYDLSNDGIGDVPHKLTSYFAFMMENYPTLSLYFYSPSMIALELSLKAFPLRETPSLEDPFPLMNMVRCDRTLIEEMAKSSKRKAFIPSLIISLFLTFFGILLTFYWSKKEI